MTVFTEEPTELCLLVAYGFPNQMAANGLWVSTALGGQVSPTSGGVGSPEHLRARLSRFQLWLPAWT